MSEPRDDWMALRAELRVFASACLGTAPVTASLALELADCPELMMAAADVGYERWSGGVSPVAAAQYVAFSSGGRWIDRVLEGGALSGFLKAKGEEVVSCMIERQVQVVDPFFGRTAETVWRGLLGGQALGDLQVLDVGCGIGAGFVSIGVGEDMSRSCQSLVPGKMTGFDTASLPRTQSDWLWVASCIPVDHVVRHAALRQIFPDLSDPEFCFVLGSADQGVREWLFANRSRIPLLVQSCGVLRSAGDRVSANLGKLLLEHSRSRDVYWLMVEPSVSVLSAELTLLGVRSFRVENLGAYSSDLRPLVVVRLSGGRAQLVVVGLVSRTNGAVLIKWVDADCASSPEDMVLPPWLGAGRYLSP